MLHLHNRYMRSTRFDKLVALAIVLFILFVLTMILGPAQSLAREQDALRTNDVRRFMTQALELQSEDPAAYASLQQAVAQAPDSRQPIGEGEYYYFVSDNRLGVGSSQAPITLLAPSR